MLQTLRIRDYALIDDIEVHFDDGLNVLTGETGAGKSIVVGALNLVLGARASSNVVRQGARQAKVDAVFYLLSPSPRLSALLREHALELEDGALVLSRVVSAEGRSRAYVCGSLVPVSVQAAVGDELVDLHGQHEHQSLLRADRQLELLDAFAGIGNEAARLGESVKKFRSVLREIETIEADDREQARRVDYLKFEAEEIGRAQLEPGEEETARSRRKLIANSERIVELASGARRRLSESEDGSSAADALGGALRNLDELASIDDRFQGLADRLRSISNEASAVSEELIEFTDGADFDPAEMDALNARLALIGDLKRKFGESVEAILEYQRQTQDEIAAFEGRDERLAELQTERETLEAKAYGQAEAVSRKRHKVARGLERKVTAILQELGMEGGQFVARLERGDLAEQGLDHASFLLSANVGEDARGLRQVASGGELSRIMLALKVTFAAADGIPTLVFDEIDAGIGGAVAVRVAEKLREVGAMRQTLCVTHLPHIAAAARTHLHVSKHTKQGRTHTVVTSVTDRSREEEVARLLDGSLTEVSLEHARTLLNDQA